MSESQNKQKRVLAIDPFIRGFGFIVFEGPKDPIDWGTKEAREKKNARCLTKISNLIETYLPDVIVVEDCTAKGSRRCPRVQRLIAGIGVLASKQGIKIHRYSRAKVRRVFSESGATTKHQIATTIAELLPELALQLPPFRKPWMPEDERMSIFDAASFAFTFYYLNNQRKGLPSPLPKREVALHICQKKISPRERFFASIRASEN